MATHKLVYLSETRPLNTQLWLPGTPASPYTAATDGEQTANVATGLYQTASNVILNGTTQYGSRALATALKTANITIMAWIKPTAVNALQAVLELEPIKAAAGHGVYLNLTAGGVMEFGVGTGSTFVAATGVLPISANVWTHVAGSYDGVNANVYKNGVLDVAAASAAISWTDGSGYPTAATLYAGAYKADAVGAGGLLADSRWFGGEICLVKIYSTALTAAQIVMAKNNVFYDYDTLTASWPMSEGSGVSCVDYGPSNLALALTATPSWGTDHPLGA